jgi:tRNA (cmo5U34)-methyltransferase
MMRLDTAWQSETLVRTFLEGVRGGIPYAGDQLEIMLRVVAANELGVKSFADLGCGSGVLAQAILGRFPAARGTLVDFSEPMLAAARGQLRDHDEQLEFVRADMATGEMWQAAGGMFDVIVSGFAIHHLPDTRKRELYGEIFAHLKPNGMFVNVEHVASPSAWGERNFDELMIDSLYAFHTRRGSGKTRDQVAAEHVHRPDKAANILAPVEIQCDWLREIGYEDVDCYFKVFEMAVFGGRRPPTR